jgi:hypothetical protein
MRINVRWANLDDSDPGWTWTLALYAYLAPNLNEILYIGKSYGCTVRQRWQASDKHKFWHDLERERGIYEHVVIVGGITLIGEGYAPRITRQKIADIESLLIYQVQPWGNIACKKTRIERPGLVVKCTGAWPLMKKSYCD